MNYFIAIAAVATLAASPALAASTTIPVAPAVTCATGPVSSFKPQATLEAQLKALGMTVRQIKVEKGCYEVYAIDKSGKKINNAYNAATLEQVANAEAGEN
ncbi:MAG: PepSY domain-containing protein [Devosia sp.]